MITSNISSNTFFFTNSEQCSSCGFIMGYKTANFIPFTPFFIPFYTLLYPFMPYSKTHNISQQRISVLGQIQSPPSVPIFFKIIPSAFSAHRLQPV